MRFERELTLLVTAIGFALFIYGAMHFSMGLATFLKANTGMIRLLFVPVLILGVILVMLVGMRFIIYWGDWCDRCAKELVKNED